MSGCRFTPYGFILVTEGLGEWAPGTELTSARKMEKIRNHPGDFGQSPSWFLQSVIDGQNRLKKSLGIGVLRMGKDLLGIGALDNLPCVKDEDS